MRKLQPLPLKSFGPPSVSDFADVGDPPSVASGCRLRSGLRACGRASCAVCACLCVCVCVCVCVVLSPSPSLPLLPCGLCAQLHVDPDRCHVSLQLQFFFRIFPKTDLTRGASQKTNLPLKPIAPQGASHEIVSPISLQ